MLERTVKDMPTEYAVMAETHEGNTLTLRRGFVSEDSAEQHPVQMKLWKRVWVAPIEVKAAVEPSLPPFPWDWIAAGVADARGSFHAYLVDATGRKIAAIWGRDHEKKLIAERIVLAANCHDAVASALQGVVKLYCDLVDSGDAGFWDPEKVDEIKHARAALALIEGTRP